MFYAGDNEALTALIDSTLSFGPDYAHQLIDVIGVDMCGTRHRH